MSGKKTKLTDEQVKEALIMFDKFDTDKSGSIDKNELQKLLETTLKQQIAPKLYDRYVTSQLNSTDKSGDGLIQFEEFLVLYEKLYFSNELPISMKPQIGNKGPTISENSNTQITSKPVKQQLTEDQLKEAEKKFKEFDKDNSGEIDRDELIQCIKATSKTKLSDLMVNRMVNSKFLLC